MQKQIPRVWVSFLMRKIFTQVGIVGLIVTNALFSSCGVNKAVTSTVPAGIQQPVSQQKSKADSIREAIELAKLQQELDAINRQNDLIAKEHAEQLASYDMPCYKDGFDTKEYFAAVGVAQARHEASALLASLENAKQQIRRKMSEFVQGVVADYSNTYRGNSNVDDAQSKIEGLYNNVVEGMLNEVMAVCVQPQKVKENGIEYYKIYQAIQIDKETFSKKMQEALSNDEKLEIDFKQEQFQKFFDERIKGMSEAKKAAGY